MLYIYDIKENTRMLMVGLGSNTPSFWEFSIEKRMSIILNRTMKNKVEYLRIKKKASLLGTQLYGSTEMGMGNPSRM